MRAHFIYNPASGQINIRKELEKCLDSLSGRGWSVNLSITSARRQATDMARSATTSGCDLVVAVGGDGTVSEVAAGLVGTDTVMGVIPAGTTNVWALQVDIPSLPPWHPRKVVDRVLSDLEELGLHRPAGVPSWLAHAFDVLLNSKIRLVDVGVAAGRPFLLWSGVGFDAMVTEQTDPEDKRRYGVLAYFVSGLAVASDYSVARMHLEYGSRTIEENILLLVASNARLYAGVLELAPRAYIDDGLLDVCVFKGEGIADGMRHLRALLAGRHQIDPAVEYMQVDRISVASIPSQPVHADDEVFSTTPVDISIMPRSLKVLVPPGGGRGLFSRPAEGRLADLE